MTQLAHTPSEHATQACIEACSHCHQVCLATAMNHCLEAGGKHVKPKHFRLLMNCAEICQTSANFQLSSSQFSHHLCAVCAEVCEACATDCEKIGGMEECVEACKECAESCRQMGSDKY
ncbi:four-helix bundle copper-binding protein [Methylomicrobium lacus]|uniref:four-helix bundle copper-binding protein n=1 Tax=Methylomicrobium lacus TaxID=136992 RepID=UPI00045E95AA|nr:four-helix bundle copper-binding protein [Methylomicrobium lacus]